MKVVNKLPGSLAIRGGSSPLVNDTEAAYNYGIGGMSWLSAASAENPIIRQTAPFRKEQFDNAQEAGEQSLGGYWLRSEQSFHGGAGLLYSDPSNRNPNSDIRFLSSKGVDVWTQGIVKLLRESVDRDPVTPRAGIVEAVSVRWGDGTDGVFAVASTASPDDYYWLGFDPNTGELVEDDGDVMAGSPAVFFSVTTDGEFIYALAEDALWKFPIGTSGPGAPSSMIAFGAPAASGKIAWLKNRLILGLDDKIYELNPSSVALPTAKYTAPQGDWAWTGLTETTTTIYAVGSNMTTSAILRFNLDEDGEIPTLTGGAVACQLPSGETALSAFGYLGTFIAIGTNKGARIGIGAADGGIQYGPLLFGWDQDSNVTDWAGRDSHLWCTVDNLIDGSSGLVRIDLATEIDTLRFAYATDLVVPGSGDPARASTVAFIGASDRKYYATATTDYYESLNEFVESGYLQTARIRYSTLEPKLFKLMRIRGPVLDAPLGVSAIDMFGTATPAHTFAAGTVPGITDVQIGIPPTLQDFISLKFTLNSDLDDDELRTLGAEMNGWQVKAWPSPPRQRIIQLPVWCYDFESDKNGARVGYLGAAVTRLLAIEEAEASGSEITFQDLDMGVNYSCVIEGLEFRQTAPPPHFQGFGGILTFTLRTLT